MATITTSDELRLYNRSRILSCLRNHSKQSRTGISELTGLSSATVTQVTADLISDNIIERLEPAAEVGNATALTHRRGRPQVLLDLRANAATTAVVTLLLNHLEVTLFDYRGEMLYTQKKHILTSSLSEKTLTSHLTRLLDKALSGNAHWRQSLKHVAVVYQGTVTSDNSGLLWSPITDVRNVDLATILKKKYGAGVSVLNDCKMIASALYHEREQTTDGVAGSNFAAILLSYGIGLGLFHRGDILTGSSSSGTEFGHMLLQADGALCRCGRYGCIEAYASDYAIWRYAHEQHEHEAPADEITAEEFARLVERAQSSDGPERRAFENAGAAIGLGLTNLFALFDPFPVVLVGTNRQAFELMETALYQNLQHFGSQNSKELINVYDQQTESSLILKGASRLALGHIDLEVFGFGDRNDETPGVHSG